MYMKFIWNFYMGGGFFMIEVYVQIFFWKYCIYYNKVKV